MNAPDVQQRGGALTAQPGYIKGRPAGLSNAETDLVLPPYRTALTLPRLLPAGEGGPPPILRTVPGDGAVRMLSAALERLGLRADPGIPETIPDGRLRSQLSDLLEGTAPNLYLYAGLHDGEESDFVKPRSETERPAHPFPTNYESLEEPLVAFVSCGQAWAVDAEPFRKEVERHCGAEAAAGALRLALRALDPLMLTWDAGVALDYVRSMHWYGCDDDRERLAEFKHELAHSRRCSEEDITDEEARAEAAGYFWTSDYVRARLPNPYAGGEGVGEAELRALGNPHIDAVLKAARRCRRLTKRLTDGHPLYFSGGREYHVAWAVVLTIGGDDGFISETYEEETRGNYESGFEEMPICGIGVDPASPESVERLAAFLRHLRKSADACVDLLRAIDPDALRQEKHERNIAAEAYRQMRPVPGAFLDEQGRLASDPVQAASAVRALAGTGGAVLPWPSAALPVL